MDDSLPSNSVPRREPTTYERTRQCLSSIANYLRRYRNHSLFQAVQNILRRMWPRQEQNVTPEIEEEVYASLYRIVESIENFQDTVQRTTGSELGVDVDIPILAPPGGTGGAIVQIRLPVNQRDTTDTNTDAVNIPLPEIDNPQERNDEYDLSPIHPPQNEFEVYEPFFTGWDLLQPYQRQDEAEPRLPVTPDELLNVEGNADLRRVHEMRIGEGIAGATEDEIERLAIPTTTDDHVEQICSVCLEQFESNTMLTILPCEHVFHPSCIRSWLRRNASCPIDRRSIFENS